MIFTFSNFFLRKIQLQIYVWISLNLTEFKEDSFKEDSSKNFSLKKIFQNFNRLFKKKSKRTLICCLFFHKLNIQLNWIYIYIYIYSQKNKPILICLVVLYVVILFLDSNYPDVKKKKKKQLPI